MIYTTITFGGIDYQCRVLKDSLNEDVIIASKEAENLYDEILYFTDAVKLQLDDAQLIELLKAESTDMQTGSTEHHLCAHDCQDGSRGCFSPARLPVIWPIVHRLSARAISLYAPTEGLL